MLRGPLLRSHHLTDILMLDYIIQVIVPKEKRKKMIKSSNKNNNTINRVITNITKMYNYDQKEYN